MILIQPQAVLEGHYHFRGRNNADQVYFCDESLQLWRLEDDMFLSNAGFIAPSAKPGYNLLDFHPARALAAFGTKDGGCGVGNYRGELLWSRPEHCSTLLFSADGTFLWTAERLDDTHLRVKMLETDSGKTLYRLDLKDPLFQSALNLDDIPGSHRVTLGLAAGQDGVCVLELWLEAEGIRSAELFPGTCYTPPCWSLNGQGFLTQENDDDTVTRYAYPELEPVVSLEATAWLGNDEEEFGPGYHHLLLRSGQAILQSNANRYYLCDSATLERKEELIFPGFEPRPVCELYPTLKNDKGLYSELQGLERVGELIIASTYRKEAANTYLLLREADLMAMLG